MSATPRIHPPGKGAPKRPAPAKVFLVPRTAIIVRDPQTMAPLPAAGAWKTQSPYWQRRINDGDATIGTPPAGSTMPSGGNRLIHK